MQENEQAVNTVSEISVSSTPDSTTSIQADYHNITNMESWPVAGLLVLLDSTKAPVRAEVHLYEELPSQASEAAIRQARQLLEQNYVGAEPVPLRIFETQQLREAMSVRLASENRAAKKSTAPHWLPIVTGLAGVAVILLAIWAFSNLFSFGGEEPAESDASSVAVAEEEVPPEPEADEQISVADAVATTESQGADLPPSVKADPSIGIGLPVRILPNLVLTLRSEPGGDAGVELGYMQDGAEAVIIGGPVMTQGNADTIVWWLLRFEDGAEAWAAANTSELTLLAPVE